MINAKNVQLFLLLLGGAICALIFVFTAIVRYQSSRRKKAMMLIEVSTSLLLFADFFAYTYRGDTSQLGFWMVRICNFLVFFLLYVELYGLNRYLCTFVFSEENKTIKRLRIADIISLVGMLVIVVSQFTGIVYSFDANNLYQRGPFFLWSFIAPLGIYLVILSVVIEYRKTFPKLIFIALMIFVITPLASAVVQVFFYGLSLLNLSIGFCAIIIFALSLMDQNYLLVKIASRDRMTGLPNAHGYVMELERKLSKRSINLYNAYYFDVARIGHLNRKYGNVVVDDIILKYVKAMRDTMEPDEVLGRLGGSFFVALVKKSNTDSFIDRLAGIPITFRMPNAREDETINVSAVAGIYEIESNNVSPNNIMNYISMAANIAKNVKKKPYIFLTSELKKEMNEIRSLQEMIPQCMAKKEFKPFYQPKVDITNNCLYGAEALARWEHDGGLIPPARFIPILEQNESICKLDFYMLEYVCEDLRKWIDDGINPPVISLNFSRKNLGNVNLAKDIYEVVKRHNIPTELIQIEITETIDEYSIQVLKDFIAELKKYGFGTAIDDFGTGSSSINMIKEVPFDVLKIDKSFIDSVSEKDRKILGYIIAMAQAVGASVITEGVETAEQVAVLKELDCTKIQGFYFDKPLAKLDFESRIRNPFYRV